MLSHINGSGDISVHFCSRVFFERACIYCATVRRYIHDSLNTKASETHNIYMTINLKSAFFAYSECPIIVNITALANSKRTIHRIHLSVIVHQKVSKNGKLCTISDFQRLSYL